MFFYLVVFSVIVLISLLYRITHNKLWIWVGAFALFAVSACRFDIGWDYPMYFSVVADHNYANLPMFKFQYNRMEPLVKAIIWICRELDNPYLFFAISSAVIVFPITAFIIKYSDYPDLSLIVFLVYPHFYLDSFSLVRQWMALAIFLCSVRYLIESKPFRYIAIVFLASLFHSSVLVVLIAYPLKNIKLSKQVPFYIKT